MTTVIYNNTNFDLVFIDPTISSAGDGSTAATALSDFPDTLSDQKAYIVRRTTISSYSTVKRQESSDIKNIAIIGFPGADDEWRSLMPAEAVSAWGSDSADYGIAVFASGDTYTLKLPNLENFFLDGVFLSKDPNQTKRGYCIYSDNTKLPHSFYAKNTKFGNISCDFSTILVGQHDVAIPDNYYKVNHYLCLSANSDSTVTSAVTLSGCEIHATTLGNDSYGTRYGFWIKGAAFLMSGTNAFLWSSYGKSNEASCCPVFSVETASELNLEDSNLYVFTSENAKAAFNVASFTGNRSARLSNVLIKYIKTSSDICTNLYTYGTDNRSFYVTAAFFQASNIVVDYTESDFRHIPGLCVFYRLNKESSFGTSKVENVKVLLNPLGSHELTTSGLGASVILYGPMGGAYRTKLNLSCLRVKNLEVKTYVRATDNVKDNGYRKDALSVEESVYLENADILGSLNIEGQGSQLHFKSVNSTFGVFPAIRLEPGAYDNVLMIDDLKSAATSLSNIYCGSSLSLYKNKIYVKKSNVPLQDLQAVENNERDEAYFNSYILCPDLLNRFYQRGHNAFCVSWGVVRQDSTAESSLKLWKQTDASSTWDYLTVGGDDFKSFEVAPASAGNKTLQIHVAFSTLYGNVPNLRNGLWFILKVPTSDGVGGTQTKYVDSRVCGVWKDDTSSWTGDSGVVSKVLEIPFTAESTSIVEVKPCFNLCHPAGYVYLDPEFKILD